VSWGILYDFGTSAPAPNLVEMEPLIDSLTPQHMAPNP